MPRGRPRTKPAPPVANQLREVRLARGIDSLAKLSALTRPRVPPSTIQRHETGEAPINTHYLEIYARALDVKPEELLLQGHRLSAGERALLELFNRLAPADRSRLLALGNALAEQAESYDAGPPAPRRDAA